jgi:hypothetical protein
LEGTLVMSKALLNKDKYQRETWQCHLAPKIKEVDSAARLGVLLLVSDLG